LSHKAEFTEVENALFPPARDGRDVDMVLACSIFYKTDGTEL
jgi:hypothetical protein